VANAVLVERLRSKVAELRLLRDRLLHIQDEERKRVARDLHDGALHTVLELARQADAMAYRLPAADTPAELHERLHDLAELGQDAADELRTVCSDLYPAELAHLGLVPALRQLAIETNRDERVIVRVRTTAFPDDCRLPAAIEEALYRVACEALENVVRHARATQAEIDVCLDGSAVALAIRDDGCGFEGSTSLRAWLRTGHLGVVSMHERLEQLGGQLLVNTAPGRGTEVCAHLTVPGQQPERLRARLMTEV